MTGAAFVDSRSPVPGGLFVAVAGERVDGHDFAGGAHAGGAAAVLGTRADRRPDRRWSTTRSPRWAGWPATSLDTLRRRPCWPSPARRARPAPRTTSAQVLAAAGPTVATAGNLNNELGVPLTVLRADRRRPRYLVVEMGARGIGHIAYLCGIAPPAVAAVLNVGTAHLGEFGSREAIAQAKGEIVEALPADGTAVLNADDDLTAAMAARTPRAGRSTFGAAGDVAWRGVELDDLGRPSFELGYAGAWRAGARSPRPARTRSPTPPPPRRWRWPSASPLRRRRRRAERGPVRRRRWRMELHERADGLVVVNDAYNANPASMAAALEALVAIGGRRRRRTVAVLGEMMELGDGARRGRTARWAAPRPRPGVDVARRRGGAGRAAIAEGAAAYARLARRAVLTAGRDEALAWVRENVAAAGRRPGQGVPGRRAGDTIADGLLATGRTERDPAR